MAFPNRPDTGRDASAAPAGGDASPNAPPKRIPHVAVLCCRQALGNDVPSTGDSRPGPGCTWRLEVLACSSKAKVSHLFRMLEAGADAVEWVACPADRCRLMDGGLRAERRAAHARALLSESGLSPERVGLSRGAALSAQDLMDRAGRRAALAKG